MAELRTRIASRVKCTGCRHEHLEVCLDIAAALRRLNEQSELTIVLTEQNVNFTMSLAQEIQVLETGTIRLSGTADELADQDYIKAAYFGA